MSQLIPGTSYAMRITEELDDGFVVEKGTASAFLPFEDGSEDLQANMTVDVFLYVNKQKQLRATTHFPEVTIDTYGWAEVADVVPHLGAFIDIGIDEEILIFSEDLPLFKSVWPQKGDRLYVTLKVDSKDRLLGKIAPERVAEDLLQFAEKVELNDRVTGHVIFTSREGSVILTEESYRGFIHHTERLKEPRLGEAVTGRVIEVKEDGTINVSLLPLKEERMDDDAAKILAYLEVENGVMPFSDRSDPDEIRDTFRMSKSAFKRALGRLMKERKINQADGKTFLVEQAEEK